MIYASACLLKKKVYLKTPCFLRGAGGTRMKYNGRLGLRPSQFGIRTDGRRKGMNKTEDRRVSVIPEIGFGVMLIWSRERGGFVAQAQTHLPARKTTNSPIPPPGSPGGG
jgi:hypothetical protein